MPGTVVVTGASTGIGEATALHLASLGFSAVGAVRKPEDATRLEDKGLRSVILDVTDEKSIAKARDELGEGPLAGLVNNAGVAVSGPLEFVPIAELRNQLEVNLIGQVAVTQAFLPALRRTRGRIVNISSIGGLIAMPLAGPYAASKFGIEAVSDALRRELRDQGIEVCVIEPGGIKTPIWQKGTDAAEAMLAQMSPEAETLYGKLANALRRETAKIASDTGLPPEAVAEQVGKALTARKPRTRTLVGRDARLRAAVAKRIPDRVMDSLIARALR
jgi:short-subunit dehydrogenase